MRVIATAGHVDHGKSTLVRALTGTDPDRWAEEHRRGLTIDLGYAWTTLPDGEELAFVDVPGHERFIANMLAGVGPAPGVLFVVAADEGWRRQSTEHLAAIRALGIEHGVVAVTRSDLADPAAAIAQGRERLPGWEVVPCSGVTGTGLPELRAALGRLCATLPTAATAGRVRLWVDRVFTMRGTGTVATGTLGSGRLAVGDTLRVVGASGERPVTIRALQRLGTPADSVDAVARVAVNLRGVSVDELARGDALLTGSWHLTTTADVRLDADADDLPAHLVAHVGTAALGVRVRPLGGRIARLAWDRALPVGVGDRLVLRDPGRHAIVSGAVILDADPPALTRRGDARRRAEALADAPATLDVATEVARRGWTTVAHLAGLGASEDDLTGAIGGVLVDPARWASWAAHLREIAERASASDPLQGRVSAATVAAELGLPRLELVAPLAHAAGLVIMDGWVHLPGVRADLGDAEAGMAAIEARLAEHPFAAPERDDLLAAGIGPKHVAAAVRLGRVLDLGEQVLVAPSAPAHAMRALAALPQPFTTSQARLALDSTRRVVIPLLTELDRRGWTRRVDHAHREVVRGGGR